jgi:radical SAM superfamily enzyme YgiQ (UPF0313 family)
MRKLNIILGDLSYDNPLMKGSLYVPLGAGFLAAYASTLFGDSVSIRIFKDPSALLDYAKQTKPDLVGFSHYFWNTALNRLVSRKLRTMLGTSVKIVLGGPSIDSDPEMLLDTCRRYPDINAIVPNEGEQGFANIVKAMLSGDDFKDALDGVAFERDGCLVSGRSIGLATDLNTVPSPYLSGIMDPFLNGEYQPLLQTSRLCPYTCAFCVSGKNEGKLRAFPIEQAKAEVNYIASRYTDRPDLLLYIADENFGILERDVEIALHIRTVSESIGYPKKLFYYNDKKFGKTSRDVHDIVGHMCFHGLTLSLQTENPETLKAIKRRNMSVEQLNEAIAWGRSKNMPITTELIFGLPMETRQSFLELIDKCFEMNFDNIHCYNLIIFDGIILNRPAARQQYEIKTKYRHVSGSFLHLGDDFCAEAEEVVVGASGFDIDDFMLIRRLNVVLYTISYLRMHTPFFTYLKQLGIHFTFFAEKMFDTKDATTAVDAEYAAFLNDLNRAINDELFDSREALVEHLRRFSEQRGGDIPEPVRINAEFGQRMVRNSNGWVARLLLRTLEQCIRDDDRKQILEHAESLLKSTQTRPPERVS